MSALPVELFLWKLDIAFTDGPVFFAFAVTAAFVFFGVVGGSGDGGGSGRGFHDGACGVCGGGIGHRWGISMGGGLSQIAGSWSSRDKKLLSRRKLSAFSDRPARNALACITSQDSIVSPWLVGISTVILALWRLFLSEKL